ncbi:MAG TPA: pantoate--beta-alanine ligase [Bacilli bacterium]
MQVVRTIAEMRQLVASRREKGETIGFVPTLGYLHEGHISLVDKAKRQCGFVVLSIFVNPLQFGPNEDYAKYPRDAKRDLELAAKAGVDAVFMPEVTEMYPDFPQPIKTMVHVSEITDTLCGASRPGHFAGVATVVLKLFNIVRPDQAFFGLKDAQQVAVITAMVKDLNVPVEIVPCPIVRDADGLALSSRNVYLNEQERQQATVLHEALSGLEREIRANGATIGALKQKLAAVIAAKPLAQIDYAVILTYPDLKPLPDATLIADLKPDRELIAALAVKFGGTRLIDNKIFRPSEVHAHV